MPTLGTLAAGIESVSAVRRSEVYLTELNDHDQPAADSTPGVPGLPGRIPQWRKFQYFPESISDTKQVNYQPKEIPGGSLPLYQFTGSGERTISFTAIFTTDVDHIADQQTIDFDSPGSDTMGDQSRPEGTTIRDGTIRGAVDSAYARLQAAGVRDRNPYIPGMLVWLRRFLLPRYGENSEVGVPITRPPHKLLLHIPGSEIELYGGAGGFSQRGGGILCVMTTCDINIDALFPSGNIRIASVSLAFAEVPQRGGVVKFPSATPLDRYLDWHRQIASGRAGSSGVLP